MNKVKYTLDEILNVTLESNHMDREYWDTHIKSQSSAMEKARIDFCYLAHSAGHPHKAIAEFLHKRESTIANTIRNTEEHDSAILRISTLMNLSKLRLLNKEGQE